MASALIFERRFHLGNNFIGADRSKWEHTGANGSIGIFGKIILIVFEFLF